MNDPVNGSLNGRVRALRVALICPYSLSVFGGVQLQVLGLMRALRALGVDARVIAPSDGPPPAPGIISLGPSHRFPVNGSIAPIAVGKAVSARTLEALRTFAPDVLHLHEPLTPGANHAALVGTDLPAVGTFHASHPGRNGWYDAFRLPLRKMIDRVTLHTAVSEEAQRNVESFGVRCEILPNGVDVDAFASGESTPTSRPAILFIGRHEPRKGLRVLLDAFERLGAEMDGSVESPSGAGGSSRPVLWILGEGPQTESLRATAPLDVEWLGPVSEAEKAARLRAATVACFPSIEGESFGVVLLEAMAAGTPIVASDLMGYRNVVRSGREALLVEPGDVAALAGALGRVLTEPGLRATFLDGGRARVAEFSMARLAESFVERYESALAGSRGAARGVGGRHRRDGLLPVGNL